MTLQHTAPFLRLLLPFSIGVYAGLQLRTGVSPQLAHPALLCCLLLIVACLFILWRLSRGGSIPSVLSHLLLLLGGLLSTISRYAPAYSNHYTRFTAPVAFLLRVTETPRQGKGFIRCEAEVDALLHRGSRRKCSGTVLLYIRHDTGSIAKIPRYGDLLRIPGKLQEIPGAAYPEGFDYGAMMWERGIRHRIFVDEAQVTQVVSRVNPLLDLAHQAALWTDHQLQQHFPRRIAAILASLLIGLRSDIESQDLEAFRNTGTLHVLAVSGMHIALIFQVLMWLTSFLANVFPRYVRLLMVALAIWAYACISGFSASVCRAALMCSIMLLGKAWQKESSLANNLCATAFLLLLWEPRWLLDAGFLLSFTAVAGIIAFQPLISAIWIPRNRLLLHIRDLLSVSCAAQLGTLPVSLYFFHQFATYFLLGNLVIIPLSTIALFGGLAFLALGSLSGIGPCLQVITALSTGRMLDLASWIGQLPNALLEDGDQNIPEATALSLFLGGCAWYAYEIRTRKPWLLLSSLLLFVGLHTFRLVQEHYYRDVLLYSRKGKIWTLLFHQGRSACVLSNDTASKHREFMQPYLRRYGLKPRFLQWNGQQQWVYITRNVHGRTGHNVGIPDHKWQAGGIARPTYSRGIFIMNGKIKEANATFKATISGRILLTGNSSGTYLHPAETF